MFAFFSRITYSVRNQLRKDKSEPFFIRGYGNLLIYLYSWKYSFSNKSRFCSEVTPRTMVSRFSRST